MKLDTIVTLKGNSRYYLVDETVQNEIKYFLATKLDENDEMTADSCIFEEIIENETVFVKEVVDESIGKYILSVFTTTLINDIDELKKED